LEIKVLDIFDARCNHKVFFLNPTPIRKISPILQNQNMCQSLNSGLKFSGYFQS